MAAADLEFWQQPGGADLVFGAVYSPPAVDGVLAAVLPALQFSASYVPRLDITLAAELPALSFSADYRPSSHLVAAFDLPGLAFAAAYINSVGFRAEIMLPDLALSATAQYLSHAQRPLAALAAGRWQPGQAQRAGAAADFQRATVAVGESSARWQRAAALGGERRSLAESPLKTRVLVAAGHQEAARVTAGARRSPFQDAAAIRLARQSAFQDAARLAALRRGMPHQEAYRDRRAGLASRFSSARSWPGHNLTEVIQRGQHLFFSRQSGYQWAQVVPPGVHAVVQPPNPPAGCYTPSGHLLFVLPAAVDGNLLFLCDNDLVPSEPGRQQIVIPVRRAYIVVNTTTLVRVIGNHPIEATDLNVSFDADSWVASFSASIPEAERDAVMPDPTPVEVAATINGTAFHFFVEKISRNRSFGKRSVTISGRGIACELDAPYAPIAQHLNTGDRTAQQLIADALQFTGYSVAWGITDWLVPAGTLSLAGSPIAVAQHVAEAAGAVLSADWSQRSLHLRPRYPVKPWDWASATPDYVIPSAVTQTESLEWVEYPSYNAVFVSGVQAGIVGHVKVAGTAADIVAPMVTHPLITHADAARQRGISILGNTGRKARMQISLPVLPESGIIDLCNLVEFSDGANTRRGVVRGNSIQSGRPVLRQTLTIEASA